MNTLRRAIALVVTVCAAGSLAAQSTGPFVVNLLPSDLSFNPLVTYTTSEAQIYAGIYEGLVAYDPLTLDPTPAAAYRWEVSADGLLYRFFIRPDARFSNGDPVTATDFRETWLLLLAPATKAAYASLLDVVAGAHDYRTGAVSDRARVGIRAVSDRVLEVQLGERAAHFLRILCHHSFVPLHRSLREGGSFADPVALPVNGPYRVASLTDELLVLERNRHYWDRAETAVGRIEIRLSDDYAAVTDAFNRGEIHWVRGGFDLSRVERPDSVVVNALYSTTYFQFSAKRAPLDDARVRRALAMLLPWQQIRGSDFLPVPARSLVPQLPGYPTVEGPTGPDVGGALALLAEAGYSSGAGLGEIVVAIPGGAEARRVAGMMKDAWESNLSVRVRVDTVPYPRYFTLVESGEFMVSTITWIGDFADPLTFLDMWTTGSNLNASGYSSREYDELVRSAMGQTGGTRYETLGEAERLLLHEAIVLPISHPPSINLIDLSAVEGWYPNLLDIHPFKYLRFASGRPAPNVAGR